MKLSEKIVQKYVDSAWELLELIKMAEQLEKENEELKLQIQATYNDTFADGLPSEMKEGEIIRKFLLEYFDHIIEKKWKTLEKKKQ